MGHGGIAPDGSRGIEHGVSVATTDLWMSTEMNESNRCGR